MLNQTLKNEIKPQKLIGAFSVITILYLFLSTKVCKLTCSFACFPVNRNQFLPQDTKALVLARF